ncbi:hypothetical protein [Legionella sp.]|uniref:hypothetical protein n=1 Tax=Legionella sp. TaxID=459 RepID=UPI003C97CDD3
MKVAIDALIDSIEEKISTGNYSKEIIQHLCFIKSILKQGMHPNGNVNIAKIHEALHYIETIEITKKSFFFQHTEILMADALSKNKETILPEHERQLKSLSFSQKNPHQAITSKDYSVFGLIHKTLSDLVINRLQFEKNAKNRLKLKKSPEVWVYEYPVVKGQVMNQAVGEWQADRMKLASSQYEPQKAYTDFQRNISIRGMIGQTEDEVTDLLNYLVVATNYSLDEKKSIKYWLEMKGGQDNNRFLDLLIASGAFTSQMGSALLKTTSLEQNWTLENGKIIFFYESMVHALFVDGEVWVNNGLGVLAKEPDPEQITSEINQPLMHVCAKIELNINSDHKVIPQIIALKIISFTNLDNPKRLEATQCNTPPCNV